MSKRFKTRQNPRPSFHSDLGFRSHGKYRIYHNWIFDDCEDCEEFSIAHVGHDYVRFSLSKAASGNVRGELDFAGEQRNYSVEWREFWEAACRVRALFSFSTEGLFVFHVEFGLTHWRPSTAQNDETVAPSPFGVGAFQSLRLSSCVSARSDRILSVNGKTTEQGIVKEMRDSITLEVIVKRVP